MNGWIIAGIVVGAIGSLIMKMLTGIRPTGWRFWVYDAPAFVAGILIGIGLAKLHHLS